MKPLPHSVFGFALGVLAGTASGAEIVTHTVETPYQNGRQEIRVLLPDTYRDGKSYRVLYVLPVARGFERRYGNALDILRRMDAHNRYDCIIVQMGFEKEPWYGDHATDPNTRQESYLKEFVVPFVEKHYRTIGGRGQPYRSGP